MAPSGQLTSPAPQALLQDGRLARSWALDATRTEVRLKTRTMWGLAPVRGVFRKVAGHGVVSAPEDVNGVITVAAASIDTNNRKRDEHLRPADFFDVASHPTSTSPPTASSRRVRVCHGDGQPHPPRPHPPLSFDATASSAEGDVWLDGEVRVNRADFGLTWNQMGMASIDNTITIHAVSIR